MFLKRRTWTARKKITCTKPWSIKKRQIGGRCVEQGITIWRFIRTPESLSCCKHGYWHSALPFGLRSSLWGCYPIPSLLKETQERFLWKILVKAVYHIWIITANMSGPWFKVLWWVTSEIPSGSMPKLRIRNWVHGSSFKLPAER